MRSLFLVLAITACSDDSGTPVDATPVIDIDNGSCGDLLHFTGELVDADSTMSAFCGVNNAAFEGGGAMARTAPNGRFNMCIPRTGETTLTVTPAAAASGCQSAPGTYTLPAIAVANPSTILAGAFWSGRMISMQRMATLDIDETKAHVMVHVDGAQRPVEIAAAHGTAQAWNGGTWAPGESGSDVLFPNVDVVTSGGSTMLTVVGGAIGTGLVPLQPGKLTLVTVLAR
ncbi:MAG TPA: hypothetical protein VK427_22760 [Kofleriaceae bacterium]|nr:hypothetical protein [Kofleriaceae bacterium]